MGLDITAISNIKTSRIKNQDKAEIWVEDGPFHRLEGLREGAYKTTKDSNNIAFRAGSYGGYGHFRATLSEACAEIAPEEIWNDPNSHSNKPFNELINFSDCEGFIGPVVSKKLHSDFVANKDKFEFFVNNRFKEDTITIQYYLDLYENWTQATKIASDNGVIIFH